MRQIILFSMVAFFIGCQQQNKSEETHIILENDSVSLRYLKEVEWPKAYSEQDTVLLDKILGEDFQMISANGSRYSKADEMAWIKENTTENDSFWYEIKRLDIYNNGTAIVSGTGHITNDTVKTVYESSNILIKRNGLWKAAASHVSGIKPVNPQNE